MASLHRIVWILQRLEDSFKFSQALTAEAAANEAGVYIDANGIPCDEPPGRALYWHALPACLGGLYGIILKVAFAKA